MINRAALLIRYKEPAVHWVNNADPGNNIHGLTLASANEDKTVYLIDEEIAESADIVREWVELNYAALLENELEGWYVDDSLWPQNRTLELFDEWFEVECHSVVVDTSEEPIIAESIEIERH